MFRDPNLSFRGLKNYKLVFWSLRFHSRLFFRDASVEVLRIWQPEDHQIKWAPGQQRGAGPLGAQGAARAARAGGPRQQVPACQRRRPAAPCSPDCRMRWRFQGHPRVWWETQGALDGISTYKLDREGKIYEHQLDNVQLRDPVRAGGGAPACERACPPPPLRAPPCPATARASCLR